ncbi:hypothetical protein PTKU46_79760 [Paraburkholderia terrae]
MRHFILAAAIAAHSFGVRKPAMATALIALSGLAHAGLTGDLRAVAVAVDLAAVATAANDTGNESDLQCGFVMAGSGTDGRYRVRRKEPEGRVLTHPTRLVSRGGFLIDAAIWCRILTAVHSRSGERNMDTISFGIQTVFGSWKTLTRNSERPC